MEFYLFGLFILFPILGVACLVINDIIKAKREAKERRLELYARIYYISYVKKVIKELFKKKTRLSYQADSIIKSIEKREWHDKELEKRQCIIDRVFAYDYEEMLYQIFAKSEYVSKDEIITRISEIKQISITEAKNIFDILIEHELLSQFGKDCRIGSILESGGKPNWNIVSVIDMNLNKWKRENIYRKNNGKKNKVKSEDAINSVKDTSEDLDLEEDEYHIDEKELWYEKESKRREFIKKRVFAYNYEEMLFQIFAPSAQFHGTFWSSNSDGINKDDIIDKISEIKHISSTEAKKIFDILVEYKLLHNVYKQPNNYELCSMLESSSCLGFESPYENCWYIVTVLDMNLDKWMKLHNYKDKEFLK